MTSEREPRFWVNTVSLDHVLGAVEGGFTQADHGSAARLRRLQAGDGMVFYSPRTSLQNGKPVQQFTAIAIITGVEPYQVTVSEDFHPWRQAVRFEKSDPVDARSLVAQLSFIADPVHWGLPFRRGLFGIPESDYRVIAKAMQE
jgi:hypothetical protein